MSMFPIASSGPLAANTSVYSFTSVPSTFTHLQLRWYSRMYSGGYEPSLYISFNGDSTSSNYACHMLRGDGSTATSGGYTNSGQVYAFGGGNSATSTANTFTVGICDILDYSNTNKNKTIKWLGGYDANGSGKAWLTSGFWANPSTAINRLDVYCDGNFAAGTTFQLYGIQTSNATGA